MSPSPVPEQGRIEETILQEVLEAERKTQKAMKGLQLLTRTISAAQDEDEVQRLCDEMDRKDVLRLIHYARELTPPQGGPLLR